MTNEKKIALLEEMLELDRGALDESMMLTDIQEWDSMAAIALIVLVDEEFGRKLSGADIRKFRKVKDILDFMK